MELITERHSPRVEKKVQVLAKMNAEQHHALEKFLPSTSQLPIHWINLERNLSQSFVAFQLRTLLVIYQGAGKLLRPDEEALAIYQGDTITIPAGCEYCVIAGPSGLEALSMQFADELYFDPQYQVTNQEPALQALFDHNEKRLQQFSNTPFFTMLRDGTLKDPKKWHMFLDCMQIWVENSNTPFFSRQENVKHSIYEHFFDPILEAAVDWFLYQMVVLDHLEKSAIVHLVIENANARYHEIAEPYFPPYIYMEYFYLHLKVDKKDTVLDRTVLQHQSSATLARIREVVDEAWDMLEVMMDRIVCLTRGV